MKTTRHWETIIGATAGRDDEFAVARTIYSTHSTLTIHSKHKPADGIET